MRHAHLSTSPRKGGTGGGSRRRPRPGLLPKIDDFLLDAEERRWRSEEVFRLAADGALRVSIGARYPLEQAADAHAAIESRATTGKVILLP